MDVQENYECKTAIPRPKSEAQPLPLVMRTRVCSLLHRHFAFRRKPYPVLETSATLVVTGASLVVTGALLVVTRSHFISILQKPTGAREKCQNASTALSAER